jgi:hypothetical protein
MFDFLRAIGLKPLEWSQAVSATGEASPYIGTILDTAFAMARAVVVFMTPDDVACLRQEFLAENDPDHERRLTGQARPNVLFEAGMAMGRDSKRTVLVEIGTLRPFSDIGGRHVLRLNNSLARRQDLAERLRSAGCAVDINGRDWHTAGSFDLEPMESAHSMATDIGLDEDAERLVNEVNKLPGPPQAVLFEKFIRPKTQTAQLEAQDEAVEYLWKDCGFLTALADGRTFRLNPDIFKALIASKWGQGC